jgi:fructokinase
MTQHRIGVDLGGTKIEIAVLAPDGRERHRHRIDTPRGYQASLEAIARLVREAEALLGVTATVGIGIPGVISPATGLVKNANSIALNGHAFDRDISALLAREVRVENDANCFALSEAVDGAGAGHRVVFGVILGTGVGAGITVDGHVLSGPNRIAGEWGHNPLPWATDAERPGPDCYCGKRGCIETFLSGPGLSRDHRSASGEERRAEELAAATDAEGHATLERYEHRLARALAHVINILDPDIIVLGGGLSNVARWYDRVPRLWSRWVFSDRVETLLLPNRHGDSSGVRGAAWLGGIV